MHDVIRRLAGTWAQRTLWLLVGSTLLGSIVLAPGRWGASTGLQSALGPGQRHREFHIAGHDGTRAALTVVIREVGEEYESTTPPADRAAMI